eukprot:5222083-Amphidinium_carterae.1
MFKAYSCQHSCSSDPTHKQPSQLNLSRAWKCPPATLHDLKIVRLIMMVMTTMMATMTMNESNT